MAFSRVATYPIAIFLSKFEAKSFRFPSAPGRLPARVESRVRSGVSCVGRDVLSGDSEMTLDRSQTQWLGAAEWQTRDVYPRVLPSTEVGRRNRGRVEKSRTDRAARRGRPTHAPWAQTRSGNRMCGNTPCRAMFGQMRWVCSYLCTNSTPYYCSTVYSKICVMMRLRSGGTMYLYLGLGPKKRLGQW